MSASPEVPGVCFEETSAGADRGAPVPIDEGANMDVCDG